MQKDLRLPQMSGNIIEESYCDKMITKYAAADQHKQSYVFVMNVEVKMHIYRFQENSHSDSSYVQCRKYLTIYVLAYLIKTLFL